MGLEGWGRRQLTLESQKLLKLLVPTLSRRSATAPSPGSSAGLLVRVLGSLGWG